jgi:hypothetical protein
MWSSIVYQPLPLVRAMLKGQVWTKPSPLPSSEREPMPAGPVVERTTN